MSLSLTVFSMTMNSRFPPDWSCHWVATIRENVVGIGAKVVAHGQYITFQMAEIAAPRDLFWKLLQRIDELGPICLGRRLNREVKVR